MEAIFLYFRAVIVHIIVEVSSLDVKEEETFLEQN